jgi:hypothetical protein
MRKLTAEDINKMLNDKILENLEATVGKSKKVVIEKGLKISHIKSGFNYTITDVGEHGEFIKAVSGDGEPLTIMPKDYKNFKRL